MSLGKTRGLQVDKEDVTDHISEHSVELTKGGLKELHEQQHLEVLQEISRGDRGKKVNVRWIYIEDLSAMWVKFSQFIEENIRKIATARALALCIDAYFTNF